MSPFATTTSIPPYPHQHHPPPTQSQPLLSNLPLVQFLLILIAAATALGTATNMEINPNTIWYIATLSHSLRSAPIGWEYDVTVASPATIVLGQTLICGETHGNENEDVDSEWCVWKGMNDCYKAEGVSGLLFSILWIWGGIDIYFLWRVCLQGTVVFNIRASVPRYLSWRENELSWFHWLLRSPFVTRMMVLEHGSWQIRGMLGVMSCHKIIGRNATSAWH